MVNDWMLGDFNGNRFIEVNERRWDKRTVDMCDYVLVNGVKFVNAGKVHEDRIRRLEDENVRGGRLQSARTR